MIFRIERILVSAGWKPGCNGLIEASEQLENRVPELEALVKHHSQYLNYR